MFFKADYFPFRVNVTHSRITLIFIFTVKSAAGLEPCELFYKRETAALTTIAGRAPLLLGLWISHCLRGKKKHFFVGEVK